jgi:hypothetical protein
MEAEVQVPEYPSPIDQPNRDSRTARRKYLNPKHEIRNLKEGSVERIKNAMHH